MCLLPQLVGSIWLAGDSAAEKELRRGLQDEGFDKRTLRFQMKHMGQAMVDKHSHADMQEACMLNVCFFGASPNELRMLTNKLGLPLLHSMHPRPYSVNGARKSKIIENGKF